MLVVVVTAAGMVGESFWAASNVFAGTVALSATGVVAGQATRGVSGVLPALLGALVGGMLAMAGGIVAQLFRERLETSRRRAQVVRRIRNALETVWAIARLVSEKHPERTINPEAMNTLHVAWERYDRVSDELLLLRDGLLEEQIDSHLQNARMIAEKVLEDERRIREDIRESGTVVPGGIIVDPPTVDRSRKHREQNLSLLRELGESSAGLLNALNARWPVLRGHETQAVPKSLERGPGGVDVKGQQGGS